MLAILSLISLLFTGYAQLLCESSSKKYNPGVALLVPEITINDMLDFALPIAIQKALNTTIPDQAFDEKVLGLSIKGSLFNIVVQDLEADVANLDFELKEKSNIDLKLNHAKVVLSYDVSFDLANFGIFNTSVKMFWDDTLLRTDMALKENENWLKVCIKELFLNLNDMRFEIGDGIVGKIDGYIVDAMIFLFGDLLNIPLAVAMQYGINDIFKHQFKPQVYIEQTNLSLDLSLTDDPYVQNNNIIFQLNGDFFYNDSSPKFLNPSTKFGDLGYSDKPQFFVHQEVFNSFLTEFIKHNYIQKNINASDMFNFDGIRFDTNTFSTLFPDLNSFPDGDIHGVDFDVSAENPVDKVFFVSDQQGGYVQAHVSLTLGLNLGNYQPNPYSIARGEADLKLQIIPLFGNALRAYIPFVNFTNCEQDVSQAHLLNCDEFISFAGIAGQFGADYGNQFLASKVIDIEHFLFMTFENITATISNDYASLSADVKFEEKREGSHSIEYDAELQELIFE